MRARIFAEENRRWWTLGALSFALFMIMLDNTIVNVALPAIKNDLHIGVSELEWVVTAYALTFAVLLLTGGKLGDLLGRRLIFTIGLVVFTASSLACGLSSSATELIGARAVQGVGSALMMPATLSIITATFAARERGMAIGIWAGVSAMALAIGPLLGGVITEHISWNWIFYVNVPIGLLGILASIVVVPESKDTSHEQRLDLPGLLASGVGLLALVYALIEAHHYGWTSATILGLFAVAASALWATLLTLSGTFEQLFTYVVFASWMFAALAAASIFVLRRRRPDAPRPFRVPGYPMTPALFIAAAAAIVGNTIVARPVQALIGLAIVATGVPAYWAWRRRAGAAAGITPSR